MVVRLSTITFWKEGGLQVGYLGEYDIETILCE